MADSLVVSGTKAARKELNTRFRKGEKVKNAVRNTRFGSLVQRHPGGVVIEIAPDGLDKPIDMRTPREILNDKRAEKRKRINARNSAQN